MPESTAPELAPSRRSRRAVEPGVVEPGVAAVPLTRRAARAAAEAAAGVVPPAVAEPTASASFELLEPSAPLVDGGGSLPAAPIVDEFEAAARLFSFTGETPIQQAEPAPAVAEPMIEQPVDEHVAPRGRAARARRPGASFTRVAAASVSFGAMAFVGLLTVGMTTPASALASSTVENEATTTSSVPAGDVAVEPDEIQAYVASSDVQNAQLDRAADASYSTASLAEVAAADGVTTTSSFFTNDPTAAIQWPFPVGVPMTFGYGMRWGRMHTGIDLTPGNGAQIHAIADGVVRSASNATGGYGVNIYIDHIIDGKLVTSHYAHMQYGSMRVKAGDHVKVGQVIGLVGNTGHSFGAHLHFEILLGGTQLIDPLPWMRANAGRMSLGN